MRNGRRIGSSVQLLLALLLPCAVWGAAKNADPGPKPAVRISVEPLGYVAPSPFYLISRLSSISLDFIDKDHLLFTFRIPGLMKRLPENTPDDDDQTIRALVLELPEGNVVAKTEWRMHDRARYLWPLANGQFLVRKRSTLYLMDKSLKMEEYLHSDTPLVNVQVSPDRQFLVAEVEAPKNKMEGMENAAPTLGDSLPEVKPVHIFIMHTATREMVARSQALNAIEIPMMDEGYLQAISSKGVNRWLIRYNPFKGDAKTLTELDSSCHPSSETMSKDVTLVMTCPRSGGDHMVNAVDMEGKKLWEQRWESRYVWPTFQRAENGSRFAYSSLQVSHSMGTMDPIDESMIMAQMVGVFDTKTGKLELVKNATPILSAGQNYALSPDGSKFVILREGALEVYDLPPVN